MTKHNEKGFSLALPLLIPFALTLGSPSSAQFYKQTNLVSDIANSATITDPLLVNPWGMAFGPKSSFWVSDQVTHMATLYAVDGSTGAVSKLALDVTIPAPPSGQAFNASHDFVISKGGASGPATFIFAGLDGTISGWNRGVLPPVPPATLSKQAIQAAAGMPAPVVYTGLALAKRGSDSFLYAANNAASRPGLFAQCQQ